MTIHPIRLAAVALSAVLLLSSVVQGQWLTQPTPGIPRTADGKPNLSAPAPRGADGKPDLSGLWHAGPKYDTDFTTSDAHAWAQTKVRERDANPAADSWSTLCLPPGPMITFSGPMKITQTPTLVIVLYEVPNNFRQIFMDGRALPPQDSNPTWQGYSIGRWEGDTLVVDTIGFNDRSLVGRPAHPHSEALRVTERYHRRDFGHIDVQMTVDDPQTFVRPWSVTTELIYDADSELLEFVCNENEKDRQHFVQPSTTTSAIHVDPALLAKYAGVYEVMTPRGPSKATFTVEADQLRVDVPGFGSGQLVPQSDTMFAFRGAIIEFVANEKGDVTHLVVHAVEGAFKGPRLDGAK